MNLEASLFLLRIVHASLIFVIVVVLLFAVRSIFVFVSLIMIAVLGLTFVSIAIRIVV